MMNSRQQTRRSFLRSTSAAMLGVAGATQAQTATNDFSFLLLGDLHYDKLEHHDLAWLKEHHTGDLSQIKNYSHITAVVMPRLFSSVRETIAELSRSPSTRAAFALQVGDLVQGLCGSEELALTQNQEALQFIESAKLGTPFLFTKGNHDVTGEGAREAFAKAFHPFLTTQTRQLMSGADEVKSARYTVQQGDTIFCFFDAYDPQSLDWLEAVMAKRTARHCFVVIHPPVVPYGARSTWHLFAKETQKVQREKLLDLLGSNHAFVLGGHIHKFNSISRVTPKGGRLVQLALSSVIKNDPPTPKDLLSGMQTYSGDQVKVEPSHSPETEAERRAVYDRERPWVKSFTYADLPGYAVVTIQGDQVKAEMYSGTSRQSWRTVDLSQELKGG